MDAPRPSANDGKPDAVENAPGPPVKVTAVRNPEPVPRAIMGDFIADLIVNLFYEAVERPVCLMWRRLSPSKRDRRERKLGLGLVYAEGRRLEDVVVLDGAHAGKRISELHPDLAVSLQSTWPRLVGRAAIARWLDRHAKGWRRRPTNDEAAAVRR